MSMVFKDDASSERCFNEPVHHIFTQHRLSGKIAVIGFKIQSLHPESLIGREIKLDSNQRFVPGQGIKLQSRGAVERKITSS